MKIEAGKIYWTRDREHVARIISLIGKWSKGHPVVGELSKLVKKKLLPDPGMFQTYEHWTKDGKYLAKDVESSLDLVEEFK